MENKRLMLILAIVVIVLGIVGYWWYFISGYVMLSPSWIGTVSPLVTEVTESITFQIACPDGSVPDSGCVKGCNRKRVDCYSGVWDTYGDCVTVNLYLYDSDRVACLTKHMCCDTLEECKEDSSCDSCVQVAYEDYITRFIDCQLNRDNGFATCDAVHELCVRGCCPHQTPP